MQDKKKGRWFITKFFCENSEESSKRLVGIAGSFTLFATLIINSVSHIDKEPNEALIQAVALLSFGALGITGFEKIFGKKDSNSSNQENKPE
jgi:fluoride ion exporter CrcB/FEX